MIVALIVAMDEKRGIGIGNRLPWHLSSDLKRFKSLTMGHHVLMGRKTFESIGRPLPGRTMIVISRRKYYQPEGIQVVGSLDQGLELAESRGESQAFVIGGGEIFAQALPIADRIYLTVVQTVAECDVFFPEIDMGVWQVSTEISVPKEEKDDHPSIFRILDRQNIHHPV